MLKVYTEIELLNEGNRSHMFPLLFELLHSKQSSLSDYYLILDNLIECDIVIWPLEFGYSKRNLNKELNHFLDLAKKSKKKIWIYTGGDYGYSLRDNNVYNFRLGGLKSKLSEFDIILPSFISDPFEHEFEEDFETLNKEKKPKIGFVGHASGGTFKHFKEIWHYLKINFLRSFKLLYADYQPYFPSSIKRLAYLKQLISNKGIQSNFILRKQYRAGVKTDEERQKTTFEFFQNIFESPYTFCMRGNGNFSVRFYETLAVGRIPFFLDTDCKLPFAEMIQWEKHIVFVGFEERNRLDKKLIDFHNYISKKDFTEMQLNNRKIWKDYLTREGYFKQIHDEFIIKI